MADYKRDRRSYDSGSSSHHRHRRHHDDGRDKHNSRKGRHHDGDWICSECGNDNFARRSQCNKCGQDKVNVKFKSGGIEIGKQLAEKSKGLFAADDWQCKMCGNVNWSRRNECNVCKSPKVGCVESRTGYGGGFNERENVEYNDRDDSDGEFDEFGRKKKKFRGQTKEDPRVNKKENVKEGSSDADEEKDEENNKSDAYKLNSDEEEDDDDDDGNDLSAYDLGDSGDEDEASSRKKESNSTSYPNEEFSKSSDERKEDSSDRGDQQKKRPRSRSRSSEREIKKFADS
ncbi:zinc finger Ran-binding domain-containing protein 2-like [Anneissia japonica]|uniref:zinc finger Ran-binding domain-containing protein 2-like n=1 Tax=Anneissia japonica TaxID=1529436 RepID=UPI001425B727|nr:zinc finger Ran-binding domain-containing protein 2-like [Anneissia japonica]